MSLQLVEQPTTEVAEKWVDLRVVAAHIGFGYQTTRSMVISGEIPGYPRRNGKKTHWRCRLSDVDAAMEKMGRAQ